MRMAAEFILRPISRKYDKAEHEPPLEMEHLAVKHRMEIVTSTCLVILWQDIATHKGVNILLTLTQYTLTSCLTYYELWISYSASSVVARS